LHLTASLEPVILSAVRNTAASVLLTLILAPGGDSDGFLYTTDATSFYGYSGGDCTNAFAGTSGATPIVAGSIAMILEANPDLTARDVRRILGLSATKNDPQQTELPWFQNGAG
jgi:subtilisin family serine protease